MIDERIHDSVGSAVQARLDELFEETDTPATVKEPEGNSTHYTLGELKSLVLSLDWEITEEVLSDFLIHTDSLGILYKNEKVILKFLQILKVLGKYIKVGQSEAHPTAFKLLDSVFCGLEKIVITENMPDLDKQKLLQGELNKYKELRKLISESKSIKDKERQKEVSILGEQKIAQNNKIANTAESLGQKMIIISDKQLKDAINDIKHFIHAEIQGLKEKLGLNLNI
jgi:hypothetical protein